MPKLEVFGVFLFCFFLNYLFLQVDLVRRAPRPRRLRLAEEGSTAGGRPRRWQAVTHGGEASAEVAAF